MLGAPGIQLSARTPSALAEFPTAAGDKNSSVLWVGLDGHVASAGAAADALGLDPDRPLASIAKIYRDGGIQQLQSLQGSFVLVIVEPELRKLTVMRDRLGGRTLHYRRLPGGHALA
ncbi:MAG: hypothetical protein ABR550_06620, partial [Wenzhouxiangellaceae bacterium]